jgi:hypothetical protein
LIISIAQRKWKENDGIQISDPICRLCHKKCIKDQTNFMLHF